MDPKAKKIFFEIHSDNPREGPGNLESTQRAYDMLTDIPESPLILDVGCGPGKQTLDLAELSEGRIFAIDTHRPFLKHLAQQVSKKNLKHRISLQRCDMACLAFHHRSFDVIWAEGSIYIIGFEKGLKRWAPFLKTNGCMAVTEVSWLKDVVPENVAAFWHANYPFMKSIKDNESIIRQAGFDVIGDFVLPEHAWWDDYYNVIQEKLDGLIRKYANDSKALEMMAMEQEEIDLYRKHSDCYGYVFYVMQQKEGNDG